MKFDAQQRAYRPDRRVGFGAALIVGVAVVLALAAFVYDRSRSDLIAPGVRIAGIDVGGLRAAAARIRLRGELRPTQADWVTLRYRALRFKLTGRQAGLREDVDTAVGQAVAASRGGWFVGRAARDLFGGRVDENIPMPVSYSPGPVAALIARTRATIDRPAQDASVTITSGAKLVTTESRPGRTVDVAVLRRALRQALSHPLRTHVLTVPVSRVSPTVTTAKLAAQYPAYIIVDRPDFKLVVYQRLRLTHTYPIAVGRAGLETPAGLHHVVDKEVDPSWHVPHSSWAGSLAGKVIPPGPQDPLVARWMGIDGLGDGIHGTNEPWSIGSAASHGCIRMLVPDVIQLYGVTPLGAPVYVI